MRIRTRLAGGATLGLLISVFVAGCSSSAAPAPIPTEQPLAPETSPAGDIPDNQVFVAYASPTGGYQLQVPEGWARTDQGTDVRFVSKLDGVQVALTNASSVSTAATLQANPALVQGFGRAVQVIKVQDVQLPAGPAVLVDFASNSDPTPTSLGCRRMPIERFRPRVRRKFSGLMRTTRSSSQLRSDRSSARRAGCWSRNKRPPTCR
jgi:hypothetical protein